MAICTFERKPALAFIEKTLTALKAKPMTSSELGQELFASKSKVLSYIRLLHGDTGQEKRIYIHSYAEIVTGGRHPRYAIGNKTDAVPPGTKTNAERYALRKADPDKHARHLAKLRAGAVARRTREKPATWMSALLPKRTIQTREAT